MELRRFGPTRSRVAVIGQGAWYIDRGDRAAAVAALRLGLDLGMNHIDTAELYGAAENIVGEAIAGRRDEVFLVSKVLPQNASGRGTIAACHRPLARLGTEWVDCYLLHWQGRYPLEETLRGVRRASGRRKILSWGVSNSDVADLAQAWQIAGDDGLVCNQLLYHLPVL